MVVHLVALTQD